MKWWIFNQTKKEKIYASGKVHLIDGSIGTLFRNKRREDIGIYTGDLDTSTGVFTMGHPSALGFEVVWGDGDIVDAEYKEEA